MRKATVSRNTKETNIKIELNLDGSGMNDINTGIPFFDHMLDQIACHGLFDLKVKAEGDLDIDFHHTIEDIGIVLGKAFLETLGNKQSIARVGSCTMPMDDALNQVVMDFSGRPYSVINTAWSSPMVAGIPTSLIDHFFHSFSVSSASNLHINTFYGLDNHHICESIFKAFGRACAEAVKINREIDLLPSTKGVL